MGKQTVESSLRIDAHFWATEPIRRFASALAQCFAAAWPHLQAGEPVKRTGLIPMCWTRGPQKTVIGSIEWGVREAEGDKVCCLLLVSASPIVPKISPQEVRLDWQTTAGEEAAFPVLLCPHCSQRCRYLYQTITPRKGHPNPRGSSHHEYAARAGEFACRLCAGLCYAGQLTSRSRSSLSACLSVLSNDLPRLRFLSEEAVTEAQEALFRIAEFQQRCAERFQQIEKEKSVGVRAAAQDAEIQLPTQEQSSKHLPGSEAREPQRPAGRPRERRRYEGKARKQTSCAGQLAPDEGYCVGCRARRQVVNAVPFVASNGRAGIKGQCVECRRGLCRMGKSNQGDFAAASAKVDYTPITDCEQDQRQKS